MNARETFRAARHQYRHGMRTAPVIVPGNPESNFPPERVSRSYRPECAEALAMATRLHPMCAQCLPRIPAAPFVSTLRTLYRHNNPRMYADNGSGRKDAGHPYRRQALRELRTALNVAKTPILPGPRAPLARLRIAETLACPRFIARDLDALATRDAAVASRTIAMGFDAIFGKKAA